MSEHLMQDAFVLLVMGMGTVFVFLSLLVVGTTLMSKILMKLPSTTETQTSPVPRRAPASNENLAEVAAVAAAVKLVHTR